MSRGQKVVALVMVVLAFVALYANLRSLHQNRDVSLLIEEHKLLAELASEHWSGKMLRDYENVRWATESHSIMKDHPAMQLVIHGSLGTHEEEREFLAKWNRFLRRELQTELRATMPAEVEKILELHDRRVASRELAALMAIGFYGKIFESWEAARQQLLSGVSDATKRATLQGLMVSIEQE